MLRLDSGKYGKDRKGGGGRGDSGKYGEKQIIETRERERNKEGGLTLDPTLFIFAVRTRNSRNSQKIISLF